MMGGRLAKIFYLSLILYVNPALADNGLLDCKALQHKALEISREPDLPIAPAEAHFAIPAAYFQGFRMGANNSRFVSSGRLAAYISDFAPVPRMEDPAFQGKGWGDTLTISLEQTGVAKSGSDLLKYFLGQHLVPQQGPDGVGFSVFKLEQGLDTANELHLSQDKQRFFLCTTNPHAPYNMCETMLNPIPALNMKVTISIKHMDDFPSVMMKLVAFVRCFSSYQLETGGQ